MRHLAPLAFGISLVGLASAAGGDTIKYAHEQEPSLRMQYELAEHVAQIAQRGLWRDPNPTPPWEWRHERKTQRIGEIPF